MNLTSLAMLACFTLAVVSGCSIYTGDVIHGRMPLELTQVNKQLVVSGSNTNIAFAINSIIISTGSLHISHSENNIIICGSDVDISHDGNLGNVGG